MGPFKAPLLSFAVLTTEDFSHWSTPPGESGAAVSEGHSF